MLVLQAGGCCSQEVGNAGAAGRRVLQHEVAGQINQHTTQTVHTVQMNRALPLLAPLPSSAASMSSSLQRPATCLLLRCTHGRVQARTHARTQVQAHAQYCPCHPTHKHLQSKANCLPACLCPPHTNTLPAHALCPPPPPYP